METVIRVVIVYVFILLGLRALGKREFGQLAPHELVTLLLIPELVSQGLIGEDFSLVNAIIAVTTLFSVVFLVSMLTHRFQRFERTVESSPSVLVHHGQIIEGELNKNRVAPDEVFSAMRASGLERLEQVRWAVLENDGRISIVPEEDAWNRAVPTPSQERQAI